MKYCDHIIFIFLISFSLSASSQVTFQRKYAPLGQNRYYGNSVLQGADSGFLVAGNLGFTQSYEEKLLLMKTDKYGNFNWIKTYDSMHSERMQKTFDNAVIVCGYQIIKAWPPVACLYKLSITGDSIWKKRYDQNTLSGLMGVTQTYDSGFVAVGSIVTAYNMADALLLKTNSFGDTLWTKRFGLQGRYNQGQYVLETSNHDIVFCGISGTFVSGFVDSLAVFFIKTDATGTLLSQKNYIFYKYIDANCITLTKDGGFLISGNNNYYAYFIRTNSNGDTLWTKQFLDNDYWTNARSVIQAKDSGFIWCGEGQIGVAWWDSFVMLGKLSESGVPIWTKTYELHDSQAGREVRSTLDQGEIIIGDSNVDSVYMIKTDGEGTITNSENINITKSRTKIFPNPFQDYIEINSDKTIQSVVLYTSLGIPIYKQNVTNSTNEMLKVSLKSLDDGVYFLNLSFTDGTIKVVPLIHN